MDEKRLPGSALHFWLWAPVAALAVVSVTAAILGWAEAWRDYWGVAIAAEVTATGVGALAGVVFRRRRLGSGAAATIGLAGTAVSFVLLGPLLVAGQELLEAVGWFASQDSDAGDLAAQALLFAVFGLPFTCWYSLPAGAAGGLIAWSVAARRHRG
jgi:hypothetical protein